jgi:hypothetical protein
VAVAIEGVNGGSGPQYVCQGQRKGAGTRAEVGP